MRKLLLSPPHSFPTPAPASLHSSHTTVGLDIKPLFHTTLGSTRSQTIQQPSLHVVPLHMLFPHSLEHSSSPYSAWLTHINFSSLSLLIISTERPSQGHHLNLNYFFLVCLSSSPSQNLPLFKIL